MSNMMKGDKKVLVPRLRFPEFQDAGEWEVKRLRAVGRFIRGLTYSASDVSESGLLVLRSTNIQDTNLVLDKDLVFVDKTCTKELLLQAGDIVICMSNGSKALVGKSAEYKGNYPEDLTIGAFCSLFRPSSRFANLAFQSEQYAKYVSIAIGGGNINNLKNSDLENFEFPVPQFHAEQQRIADCLSSLDELITAQSEKLAALKTHKKGLMQQLFPREGETLPRLRFPEFQDAGEWEEKQLGDKEISNFVKSRISLNELQKDSYVSTENILPDFGGIREASKLPPSGSFTSYKPGDILIANIRPYLKKVWVADKNGGASNDVIVVRSMNSIRNAFLSSLLKSDFFIDYVMKGAKGLKMPRGDISLMKKYSFGVPSPNEQQRIADCLTSLDALIAAQSEKLDALKTHKKGLMQQLFPSSEAVGV